MKKDITSIKDIKLLVNSFYDKIRNDALLKDIFNNRIKDQWPKHLEKMYGFWQTVLLNEHAYNGSPFKPHADLPITKKHFEQWLYLFTLSIDEYFEGEKADEAKWRAHKMAEMFQFKIDYYKSNKSTPL